MARNSNRRGVTLAELCVVMALVAILSMAVVTFCVMISNHTGKMAVDREVKDGISYVDLVLDVWVSEADGYTITKNNDGQLSVTVDKKEYYLKWENGYIEYTLPNNQLEQKIRCPRILSLTFSVESAEDGGESGGTQLISCTVKHEKPFATDGASGQTVLMRATRIEQRKVGS